MGIRQNGPVGLSREEGGAGARAAALQAGPLGTAHWHGHARLASAAADARTQGHAEHATVNWKIKVAHDDSPKERFKQAYLDLQIKVRLAEGKQPIQGLPEGQLTWLRPRFPDQRMHNDVAPRFLKMWAALESDLAAARKAGDPEARKVVSVAVASTYRDASRDRQAWLGTIDKYLRQTAAARAKLKDPYGHEALRILFHFANGKKAPPGFSGHTHGIAADLHTVDDRGEWTVNSDPSHRDGWLRTWLYDWLSVNASKHRFFQLTTEEWHWEYHADSLPHQVYSQAQQDHRRRGRRRQ
jgi:hypothetical protein